jgi:hypothetical protein
MLVLTPSLGLQTRDINQNVLAHMTLRAPNNTKIIKMETFEGLLTSIECYDNHGKLHLTFVTKEAFDTAVYEWTWINLNAEDRFILIVNHDACGVEKNDWQPY